MNPRKKSVPAMPPATTTSPSGASKAPSGASKAPPGASKAENRIMEAEITQSIANIKAVFDNSPDLLCSLDTESRIVTYNSTMERVMQKMFGLQLEKGLRLWDVVPAEECACWKGIESRVLAGEVITTERHYNYTSGDAIVEFTLYPIFEGTPGSPSKWAGITGTCVIARNVTEQRAISAALARSEEDHRRLCRDGPLPMIVLDPVSLRILQVNHTACELYQYSEAEFLELTLADLRPAEDRTAFLLDKAPQITIREGTDTVLTRHCKKNGDMIDVEVHSHPTVFKGSPARIAMFEDVTGSLRAKHELTSARANLKAIFDSTRDQICSIDLEGRLLTFNPEFREAVLRTGGVEIHEGMNLHHYVPPEEGAFWRSLESRVLAGEWLTEERVYRTPNPAPYKGEPGEVTMEFSLFPIIEDSVVTGACIIGRNITESRRTKDDLMIARANLKAVFDNLAATIFSVDLDHCFTTFNSDMEQFFQKHYGIALGEGMCILDMLPPDGKAFWSKVFDQTAKGKRFTGERTFFRPSGEMTVEFTATPLLDGKRIIGTSAIGRNITERKRTMEQLEQQRKAVASSEEEARRLFQDAPLPMIVFEPASLRILRVNQAACELYEYTIEEFLKLTLEDIQPIGTRHVFLQDIAPQISMLQGGRTVQARNRKKSGELFDIELHSHPTVFNGIPARISLVKDISESLRARNELAIARATLKSVLDSTTDSISAIDTEHRLVTYNAYLKHILFQTLGIDVQEGIKLSDFVPPDEAAFWYDLETRALAGEAVTSERVYPSPYGQVTVAYSLFPIRDGDTIIGASSFGKDITLQRRAEEEQRKLFDESPMPMSILDVETLKFLRVNRAACDLYEYTESEFLGMTPRDLHLADEIYTGLGLPRIQDLDDERPLMIRHKKKSGIPIDVLLRNHVIQFGGRVARMALIEDITERLHAENALLGANERFRLATEAVSSVIYDWDIPSGTVINSPGLLPLLGFDPSADSQTDSIDWWNSRIHPEDKLHALAMIDQALAADSSFEVEYRIRHNRGHYVYVWDRGIISRDEHGTPMRVVGSTQDITARKRMEAQLVEERNHALTAKESAEEMSRLKTNFLANMSHEIRTPMTAILGFAEILAEGINDPEKKRHAAIIQSSAHRLLDTINSILVLARAESKKIKLTPSAVQVNEETQRLVSLLEPLASQRGVELRFVPSSEPSAAVVDAHYLSQIVTNLIGNAIKFTSEGHVAVRVQMAAETDTPVPVIPGFASFSTASHPIGKHFRIVVEDSGIGISTENLALIFDEFKQESVGYGRSHEGTGLGLTISNRLAQAMGGSIEVRTARGVGSTFIVRLPLVQETPNDDEARHSGRVPEETRTKARILLVEDSMDTGEMVALLLRPDYEVRHVASAEAARIVIDQVGSPLQGAGLPDLILMDLNLGSGMSGLELTEILRRDERTSSLPIIALTAYAMPTDRQKSLDAGCNDYLSKPFKSEQLRFIVAKHLVKE